MFLHEENISSANANSFVDLVEFLITENNCITEKVKGIDRGL